MWEALPDDVLAIVMTYYRQHWRRRLVHRTLRRVLRYHRKALDSAHPFYTPLRRAIILENSLIHAWEHGDLALGPRLRDMVEGEVMPFTMTPHILGD